MVLENLIPSKSRFVKQVILVQICFGAVTHMNVLIAET